MCKKDHKHVLVCDPLFNQDYLLFQKIYDKRCLALRKKLSDVIYLSASPDLFKEHLDRQKNVMISNITKMEYSSLIECKLDKFTLWADQAFDTCVIKLEENVKYILDYDPEWSNIILSHKRKNAPKGTRRSRKSLELKQVLAVKQTTTLLIT